MFLTSFPFYHLRIEFRQGKLEKHEISKHCEICQIPRTFIYTLPFHHVCFPDLNSSWPLNLIFLLAASVEIQGYLPAP